MTPVTGRAVLTKEASQLSMQLGTGCHGPWFGFAAPRSHGYLPNPFNEIRSVAGGLGLVSVRQAAEFSFLRTVVMNLLRRAGYRSIRQGLRELAYDIRGMLALGGVATTPLSTA